jgi:AcrR family transcriptional regulator
MAARKKKEEIDLSTEERIKTAARKLFTKKGFAGTKTRDISEEAGINLALLNYYYGSKEKLFGVIMTEILQNFFQGMIRIFDDEKTSLEEKIETFVSGYTALLKQQPDLPLFVFHELRLDPRRLATKMGVNLIFKSFFFKQLAARMKENKITRVHPIQYVINLIAMCVFPFIGGPLLRHIAGLNEVEFDQIVDERGKLIPKWMDMMLAG